jgi:branched-chain amino acid transport system ATP-binding protein
MSPAEPGSGAPLLRVRNLQARYGDVQVLWDVSLEAWPGELVVVVGANGAGKTSTLRAISGLIEVPAGMVELAGEPIRGVSSSRIVEMGIGHVPEGRALFPQMSVRDNLELGAWVPRARRGRRASLDRVFALFPRLEQRQHQLAGTLSGGEQQMCAIGRGLMSRPSLLLLDEPSLGLSPRMVDEIFDIVARIREAGVAVLLVEQHVANALELADRAYVLTDGRTTGSGTGPELLADPAVRAAYLGV